MLQIPLNSKQTRKVQQTKHPRLLSQKTSRKRSKRSTRSKRTRLLPKTISKCRQRERHSLRITPFWRTRLMQLQVPASIRSVNSQGRSKCLLTCTRTKQGLSLCGGTCTRTCFEKRTIERLEPNFLSHLMSCRIKSRHRRTMLWSWST